MLQLRQRYNPNNDIQIIGHIEFEYWAENKVRYDKLILYIFGGIFSMGACICLMINLVWKNSIEEQVDTIKSKIWKLRGKNKEYVQTNAPGIIEMVSEIQNAAYPNAHINNKGKTKIQRIHDAELNIENAWCCTEGLLPVKSTATAMLLCILNILIPGFGTLLSTCFANVDQRSNNDKIVPEVEEEDGEEEAEADGEDGSEKKMLTHESKGSNKANKKPPVVVLDKKKEWSKQQAALVAFAQFVSAPCGIGWLWSMSHGCVLFENAQVYAEIERIRKEPERATELDRLDGGREGSQPTDNGDQGSKNGNKGQFG